MLILTPIAKDFEEAIAQTCIEHVNEVTGVDFLLEEPLSN